MSDAHLNDSSARSGHLNSMHPDTMRHDLNELVSRVRTVRVQRRLSNAIRSGWAKSCWWLLLGPVVIAVLAVLGLVHAPSWPWIAASALGPFVLAMLQALVQAASHKDSREVCLQVVDDQHGLKDRLVTADEFLRASGSSKEKRGLRYAFSQAALHDAIPHLARMRDADVTPQPSVRRAPRWLWLLPVLGTLVGWWTLDRGARSPRDDGTAPIAQAKTTTEGVDARLPSDPKNNPSTDAPPPNREREPAARKPAEASATEANKNKADDKKQPAGSEELRAMEAASRAGASADALTRARPSASLGSPSEHAEKAKRKPHEPKKSKKNAKPVAEVKRPPGERPKKPEQAGATAGRGSSRGSKSNPIANPWSSKDQAPDERSDDLEFDEDVDDEYSDSESRGGMQPNLRDRRPPVNRDLGIGFGNKPNPDANGRGGPSQRKKSRGTASLILGVPIPDHVKGLSNPGTTKVTHERTRPMPEQVAALNAEGGVARTTPLAPMWRPTLSPWARDLMRRFFARSTRSETTKTDSTKADPSSESSANDKQE